MIGKKTLKTPLKMIDYYHRGHWNILRVKGGKPKTTKGITGCYGILKLAGGIVGGVLVKDYAVYKKWINELM